MKPREGRGTFASQNHSPYYWVMKHSLLTSGIHFCANTHVLESACPPHQFARIQCEHKAYYLTQYLCKQNDDVGSQLSSGLRLQVVCCFCLIEPMGFTRPPWMSVKTRNAPKYWRRKAENMNHQDPPLSCQITLLFDRATITLCFNERVIFFDLDFVFQFKFMNTILK